MNKYFERRVKNPENHKFLFEVQKLPTYPLFQSSMASKRHIIIAVVVALLVGAAAGLGVGVLVGKKDKGKVTSPPPPELKLRLPVSRNSNLKESEKGEEKKKLDNERDNENNSASRTAVPSQAECDNTSEGKSVGNDGKDNVPKPRTASTLTG